jgi:hypothetical protein
MRGQWDLNSLPWRREVLINSSDRNQIKTRKTKGREEGSISELLFPLSIEREKLRKESLFSKCNEGGIVYINTQLYT